jgi:hypothetical protein
MRQQSVQQQNLATEEAIRRRALYWRSVALPTALVEVQHPPFEETVEGPFGA